ncbi:MAG TPA: tetratricopeptide repeat protein, partial [Allosphingosinicella sp.]|nr:tetratricopeptide repeat protein [Allosphingosinicella sp.]
AGTLAQAHDYHGAHEVACRATSIDNGLKSDQGWVELSAELARLAGHYEMTIELLKPIVNSKKVTANSLFHYALANHEAGNPELVATSLRAAQRLNPQSMKYLPLLCRLQSESGNHQAALRTSRLFQKLFPRQPLGLVLEGDASLSLNRWDQALSSYRQAIGSGFTSAAKFYNLAIDKERGGDWSAAIELHKLHLAVAGEDAASYANMAADYYELGNGEEALASARRAVELDPSDPLNLNMLANLYLAGKDYGAATPLLTRIASMEDAPEPIRTTAARNLAALDASERS